MKLVIWRDWLALLLWFAVAVLVGLAIGHLWQSISIAGLLYAVYSLFKLRNLTLWIDQPTELAHRQEQSAWSYVYQRFANQHKLLTSRERRLKRFLSQYRRSMAALPDGVIFLDQNDKIVWLNDAAEYLLELDNKKDHGHLINHLVRHPRLSEFLKTAENTDTLEYVAPHVDNLMVSLRVVRYGAKQYILLVRDISNQKRIEHIRRAFVDNASHELRTPLTVIRGYAEALVDDYTEDSVEYEALHAINTQAVRMHQIVDDMLTLARLESSGQAGKIDNLSIANMVRTVVNDAELLIQEHNQTIQLDLDKDWGLRGRRLDIHSVIQNLVVNAIRYAGKNSVINISWQVHDEGGELTVTDNGVGIPANHINRLTERFYRIDSGRGVATGGTGLGLAIVKHALEGHQASLSIESQLADGARFCCSFPRQRLIGLAEDTKA